MISSMNSTIEQLVGP